MKSKLTRKCLLFLSFSLVFFNSIAQSEDVYNALLVPVKLKTKSNAVVRYEHQKVEIMSFDKMYVTTKRIVTIFNEYGDRHHDAYQHYDSNIKIKELEAHIYNTSGEQIKKIKEKDFVDESAVSGGTLYSDSRVKYLSYTPRKYPYTIEFYSEVEYRSTAFVPEWRPIDDYFLAIQYSEYKLINGSDVTINYKIENMDDFPVTIMDESHFIAKDVQGIKPERYSPNISDITPSFKAALTKFDMEGVVGVNNSWEDFGKWMYDDLLMNTDKLPDAAINKINFLTEGITDKVERAKVVYQYVQDRTRYISVQVGIGGWKPMLADEVDRLGYADCKGLTNYTKALLEAVDVPSYYTVVWGDKRIKNIDKDFSATEGNHVILCVPNDEENIFLECTNQTTPFGYIAGFTDDRDVLLITPEGGKIVHTKVYEADESLQKTNAVVMLDTKGGFTADVSIAAAGYQYGLRQEVENKSQRDRDLYYKNYWDNINRLTVNTVSLNNDKDDIIFEEKVSLTGSNYASKTGDRLIFEPNMFNKVTVIPPRYTERKLDFKIDRDFKDVDEFLIHLPKNLSIEAMSDSETINTKFGNYSFSVEVLEDNQLKYTRTYTLKKGSYPKEDYERFRDFTKKIVKADKSKIVLVSK